jgi:hypothetical protein
MEYVNLNKCKSFKQTLAGGTTALSGQVCSEVIVVNRTTADILIYDGGNSDLENGFLLANLESATFRGITNSSQVSAYSAGGGDIYYRTQYFSNSPSR